ncbi:hypothetical protein VCUG_02284 [Vavraia culicis subsp. floridensis]|uniref:Uncharacterized protein n=1 Tax=Vavraia culicis (isolate floridensis) TaxID=948595 RepID=L2GSG6_VAVCU|nr:uncharacterized protein VCUG_02284 [Vavraia culicis subsp. floridensis]ELA46238.1 hypothetical protein VCUG_02284 [Vavraia culicis subsp. floridensis]
MVYISYDNQSIKRCKIKGSTSKKAHEPSSNYFSSDISSELDISTFYSDLHHLHQFILNEKRGHALHGDDTIVYLHGEWDHDLYVPGMCIRIIECRCCGIGAPDDAGGNEGSSVYDRKIACNGSRRTRDKLGKKVFDITNTNRYLLLVETPTLPVTNLVSGMECPLQPLFNEKIEGLNFLYDDRRIILGKLFHVMLQCETSIDTLLNEHSLELYSSNLTESEAKKCILDELPKIIDFRKKIHGKNEEYIYSPLLQMKGIIDIVDNGVVEIKTGNFNTKDVAQVLLYYLISGIEPLFIYYLKSGSFFNVKIKHFDVVSVLNRRNAVAFVYFMWNSMQCNTSTGMNQASKKTHEMSTSQTKCDYIGNDSIEMNAIDDISASDSDLIGCDDARNEDCDDVTRFLDVQEFFTLRDFYTGILRLCKCRFSTSCRIIESILRMKGEKGLFLRRLMENIMTEEAHERKQCNKRLSCMFVGQTENILEVIPVTQMDERNCFDTAENVFLNVYDGRVLVTTAEIISNKNTLKLRLNHYYSFKLKDIRIEEKNSNLMLKSMWYSLLFIAIKSHLLSEEAVATFKKRENVVSTDKDMEQGGNELVAKFLCSSDDSTAVSGHVNGIITPSRAASSSLDKSLSIGSSMGIPRVYMDEFLSLNDGQKSALNRCLTTSEFCTIHGMPGTGKSKVIALLIKILLFYGRSVLMVCYTNLSISNVVKRLSYSYYRAGSIKQRSASSTDKEKNVFIDRTGHKSVKEWREYYDQPFVVSTCYNFRDPVFKERTFDYLIIDEASQQHILLSLIPISISRKFVLVGDPLQLYPLARSFRGISLLEFLGITCVLNRQYRMKRNIMRISNEMFYGGRMETCMGDDGELELIDINGRVSREHGARNSSNREEHADRAVCFDSDLFSDFLRKLNGFYGKAVSLNDIEKIVRIIDEKYDEHTTILCYFNATVEMVKQMDSRYRVSTIDKYQGCESDSIILLMYPFIDNMIMNSRERLNVALTRAKNRLIIICEKNRMKEIELFDTLQQTIAGTKREHGTAGK